MAEVIYSILIVGGGTAGWMTAALLSRFLEPAKCRIVLIESSEIGTIGVGEATVPPLVSYLKALGIDEREFMIQCHASYKLGIEFVDWHQLGDSIWHPFGQVGGSIDHLALFHHWLRCRQAGHVSDPYTDYSLQRFLAQTNKSVRSIIEDSVVSHQGAYAYHFDANAFAAYLTRYATARGVTRVIDTIKVATVDSDGGIDHVETAANGQFSADLYIDCTGFSSLLMEKTLGDAYIDWSMHLFCDRALTSPLPYDARMPPYTQATARTAGWIWRIPLSHRVGCGYVYSSNFTSDEDAVRELVAYTGQKGEGVTLRRLNMRVGRRQNFWRRNCVAIGLSAGFLEPLESTGLFLVQKGLELLFEHFPGAEPDEALARRYNVKMGAVFEEVRDFIVLHYVLTGREDTEFWRANRNNRVPASLQETLELYDQTGLVNWEHHSLFGETSFYAIASGFGRLPKKPLPLSGFSDSAAVRDLLMKIRKDNIRIAQSLPDHGDYIRSINASGRLGESSNRPQ